MKMRVIEPKLGRWSTQPSILSR